MTAAASDDEALALRRAERILNDGDARCSPSRNSALARSSCACARSRASARACVAAPSPHHPASVSASATLGGSSLVGAGGVIVGHDYLDGALSEGVFGVRSAVDAFVSDPGLPVHVSTDDAPWPGWLVIKPVDHPDHAPTKRCVVALK